MLLFIALAAAQQKLIHEQCHLSCMPQFLNHLLLVLLLTVICVIFWPLQEGGQGLLQPDRGAVPQPHGHGGLPGQRHIWLHPQQPGPGADENNNFVQSLHLAAYEIAVSLLLGCMRIKNVDFDIDFARTASPLASSPQPGPGADTAPAAPHVCHVIASSILIYAPRLLLILRLKHLEPCRA